MIKARINTDLQSSSHCVRTIIFLVSDRGDPPSLRFGRTGKLSDSPWDYYDKCLTKVGLILRNNYDGFLAEACAELDPVTRNDKVFCFVLAIHFCPE